MRKLGSNMAKKPNISREEIHQACWKLIEQKQFPNIPRLANYFQQLDGRKCSNTTLLNAITEWQEIFEEQQNADTQGLSDLLKSPIEQFIRNTTKQINQMLDEKQHSLEETYSMKQQSIDSEHLSLSQQVAKQEEEISRLKNEQDNKKQKIEGLENKIAYSEQRLEEVMRHNQSLKHQLIEKQQLNEELRLNKAQQELNLAKQDHKITSLTNELKEKTIQLTQIQESLRNNQAKRLHTNRIEAQLEQLQTDMAQLIKSHGANKQ